MSADHAGAAWCVIFFTSDGKARAMLDVENVGSGWVHHSNRSGLKAVGISEWGNGRTAAGGILKITVRCTRGMSEMAVSRRALRVVSETGII